MRTLRPLAVVLAVLVPLSAFAQLDDDLLAPLTDEPTKKKKKKAPPKKAPPPPKKEEKKAPPPEDDLLLESLVSNKTELLVKLPSGFKGAQLFVDGKDMGQVTGGAVEVAPGEHTVLLKRVGYADFTKKVTVTAKQVTEVAASMEPVAGVLAATVDPADAEIFVDGQKVGVGQVKDLALIPGNRVVTFKKAGMQEEKRELSVKPGKDYPLAVTMKPAAAATTTIVAQNVDRPEQTNITNPNVTTTETAVPMEEPGVEAEGDTPMYKRWYVWAGIGAVVAGAAAGAIAVSQNGNATNGGVQPNTVCGGDCDGTINWPGLRF